MNKKEKIIGVCTLSMALLVATTLYQDYQDHQLPIDNEQYIKVKSDKDKLKSLTVSHTNYSKSLVVDKIDIKKNDIKINKFEDNDINISSFMIENFNNKISSINLNKYKEDKNDNSKLKIGKDESEKIDKDTPVISDLNDEPELYNEEELQLNIPKFEQDFLDVEIYLMYQIMEAEVGGDGHYQEKYNVASVIFNRLKSNKYPNTLYEVLTQKYQFSPYDNGAYLKMVPNDLTKKAVHDAYVGADSTGGALGFNICPINNNLYGTYLFTDGLNIHYYK